VASILREPVSGPSVWRGDDFVADRSWDYRLDDGHVAELGEALLEVKKRDLGLIDITAADFPLPTLSGLLANIGDDICQGRGFAMLRGFPVQRYDPEDLERMYWGLCAHIGTGRSQNGETGFIHYVTTGERRPTQGSRGVGFPRESPLHVDLTDVVSLLCVRQAPDDPPSRLASSITVYNELLKRRPDVLHRLYDGFEWDRMNEHGPGETPASGYRVPMFSNAGGVLSCRYNRTWIRYAYDRNNVPMSAEDSTILDLVDDIARETCFEFQFQDGDIQFCNNYTVLHGRAAHNTEEEDSRRRLLLRIWIDIPKIRAFTDEALIRYGIVCHGQLGWTADDVRAGRNLHPRPRRADGAVAMEV